MLASVTAALVAPISSPQRLQQKQSAWDYVEESRWARWRCVGQHWTAPVGLFNKHFHLSSDQSIKTKARIRLGFLLQSERKECSTGRSLHLVQRSSRTHRRNPLYENDQRRFKWTRQWLAVRPIHKIMHCITSGFSAYPPVLAL